MENSQGPVEIQETNCSRWSELEFVDYCQNELASADRADLEAHLEKCPDCRERFLLCLNVILTDYSPEEAEADSKLLASPMWQRQKEELARSQAEAMRPALSRPKPSRSAYTMVGLKVAAMLLVALAPLALTYRLLIQPLYDRGGSVVSKPAADMASSLTGLAEGFEAANLRLKSNPEDLDALLERGNYLERLLLYQEAKRDYERYLSLEQGRGLRANRANRAEVEGRVEKLAERLGQSATAPLTRYGKLDQKIDAYLSEKAAGNRAWTADALGGAELISREMLKQTGEHFGEDLVLYYRGVRDDAVESLLEARKLRAEVEATLGTDNFTESLEKANRAKAIFEQFGAKCDIEQTDIQVARYLRKTEKFAQAQDLLDANIKRAAASRHLFSHAQFLFIQGEKFSDTSNFAAATEVLEAAIRIANPLNVPQFLLIPSMSLASIYEVTNNNAHAFEQAHNALQAAWAVNNRIAPIQLTQTLGRSAFNLNYPGLAEHYLQHSIALAEEQKNSSHLAMAHTFFGIVLSEQHRFAEAEENFNKAFRALEKIADTNARTRIEVAVTGYYARSQMLAGNAEQAIDLYTRTLALAERANIQQKLALSQFHQGLAECLIAQGDRKRAESELAIAIDFDRQARERFEVNNSLLTFAVTRKNCHEQMRLLKQSSSN